MKDKQLDLLLVELTGELFRPGSLRGQTIPTSHQLAYLAQAARQKGINADYYQARPIFDSSVAFRDPTNHSFPEPPTEMDTIKHIESVNPKIVAFGMMCYQMGNTIALSRELKRRNPQLTILGGGYGPTAYPEILLDNPGSFDYLAMGNSFATLPFLAKKILKGELGDLTSERKRKRLEHRLSTNDSGKFEELSNILPTAAFATLEKGELVLLERVIEDDQFDASKLDVTPQKPEYAGVSGFIFPIPVPEQRSYNINASFGCGFNCTYCSTPSMFGTGSQGNFSSRFRDPKTVAAEISLLARQNGANTFFFTDPNFNFDGNYMFALASEVINSKRAGNIPESTFLYAMLTPFDGRQREIHGFPLNQEEARLLFAKGKWGDPNKDGFSVLKEAGFGRVAFGGESFSERNLKAYRRLNQISDLREYNQAAHNNGICTRNFYFISDKDDMDSLESAQQVISDSMPHEIRIAYYAPTLESMDGRRFFAKNLGQELPSGFKVDREGIYKIFKACDAGHNVVGIKGNISNEKLGKLRSGIARKYYSSPEYAERVGELVSIDHSHAESVEYFNSYLKSQGLKD